MEKPELVIAVPTDKPLGAECLKWLQRKAAEVAKELPGLQVVLQVTQGDCAAHTRNTVVHLFLENKNAVWLWMVEVDLMWEAWHVGALVRTKRPVIGTLTTTCEEWPKWQVSFYDEVNPDESGVIPVPEVSANGLLVHRTAFERILAHPPHRLDYRDDGTWQTHHAFFQQARVDFRGLNRLLREEHFFCWLCRESGIGIFVHGKIRLNRIGHDGETYPKEGHAPNLVPVPAPDVSAWPVKPNSGRFVVLIQHHEGDKEQAYVLRDFIINNSRTSVAHTIMPVENLHRGLGYPEGPNRLALELMKQAATSWAEDAKCILLIEPDCVPVAPDWIDQLSEEWDRAAGQGKLILGHWQKESGGHINGNLMFSPTLANVVDLGDAPPVRPWDIAYPPLFEPHWARTGLIKNLYRRTDVTDAEIETPAVGTRRPVLIHGVRDDSVWNYLKRKLCMT